MNKKKLLLVAFAVMMVLSVGTAALLAYYGQITTTVNVEQAIVLSGDGDETIEGVVACSTVTRNHVATNGSTAEIPIGISTIVLGPSGSEATTVHKGTLTLTKKVVDFEVTPWEIVPDTIVEVEYVMIGEFDAVVTSGARTGYELIYYKDLGDMIPGEAIKLAGIVGDLPTSGDKNLDEIDYCAGGDRGETYKTCHGAKIWYVPTNAISGTALDWSMADEFYFEKEELVQNSAVGNFVMYPGEVLDFSTETTFHCESMAGTYDIETTVDLVE